MTFYDHDFGAHRIAVAYDERLVPWLFAHWADRLVAIAEAAPSAQVVDLACGTGLMTRSFLEHLGDDGRVHGVDADAAMLAVAAGRTSDPRVSWHEADAAQIPIESSTSDVVVCNQGLQFFSDRPAVLAEVSRVLCPGGRVAIAVWGPLARNPWPAAMAVAVGDALGDDVRRGSESVCGLGDPDEVRRLLTGAGFVGVESTEVELTATHPDVREAIESQLAALPSAAAIEALGTHARGRIVDAMGDRLDEWTDARGALAVPSTCVLATATTPT